MNVVSTFQDTGHGQEESVERQWAISGCDV